MCGRRLKGLTIAAMLAAAADACHVTAHRPELRDAGRTVLDWPGVRVDAFQVRGSVLAISPDGNIIALVGAGADGVRRLYVRRADESAVRSLAGTEQASQPFFSPDNRSLGFVTKGQLKKVSLDGGAVATLTAAESVYGTSWGRNDQIVFSSKNRLFSVPAAGGTPGAIADFNIYAREVAQRWPLLLSDGKTVLYTSVDSAGVSNARIGVASIDSGSTKVLPVRGFSPLGVGNGYLVYGSETNSIMAVPFDTLRMVPIGSPFVAEVGALVDGSGAMKAGLSRTGSLVYQRSARYSQVVLTDTAGRERILLDQWKIYRRPRLSPDGGRLLFSTQSCEGCSGRSLTEHVWLYEFSTGKVTQLTTKGTFNSGAEWMPDGKRITYQSDQADPGGKRSLWSQGVDVDAHAEPMIQAPGFTNMGAEPTPDGRAVVYAITTDLQISGETKSSIWYRRLDGDTTPKALTGDKFQSVAATVSPDGQWLAYTSDESGVRQVYVQSFPEPSERHQVSTDGGAVPRWSRDGRRVFYTNNHRLLAATLTTAPPFAVTDRVVLFQLEGYEPGIHRDFEVALDDKHFFLLRGQGAWPDGKTVFVPNWMEKVGRGSSK